MTWLIITISFYLILAIVFLVDKYLLTGLIPNPGVYTFYVGVLGILALILVPFVGFYVPAPYQIILSLLAGAIYVCALFWFYKALSLFEASRVVPAINGLVPLFTFGLVYFSSLEKETLSLRGIIAFILLVLGSIFITLEKKKLINLKGFQTSVLTALLLSSAFTLTKYVYLGQPFWNGFIWTKIGGFLTAFLLFLFMPEIRKEIFREKATFQKRTFGIFILNQTAGAGANILQNLAFALVPLAYLAVVNALQGIQYVFLLIFTAVLSVKFPQVLKEEISKKIILQKAAAVLLIGGGLALLMF